MRRALLCSFNLVCETNRRFFYVNKKSLLPKLWIDGHKGTEKYKLLIEETTQSLDSVFLTAPEILHIQGSKIKQCHNKKSTGQMKGTKSSCNFFSNKWVKEPPDITSFNAKTTCRQNVLYFPIPYRSCPLTFFSCSPEETDSEFSSDDWSTRTSNWFLWAWFYLKARYQHNKMKFNKFLYKLNMQTTIWILIQP